MATKAPTQREIRKNVLVEPTFAPQLGQDVQAWELRTDGKARTVLGADGKLYAVSYSAKGNSVAYRPAAQRPLAVALSKLANDGLVYVTTTVFDITLGSGTRYARRSQDTNAVLHLDGTCAMQAPTEVRTSMPVRVWMVGETLNSHSDDGCTLVAIHAQSVTTRRPTWVQVQMAATAHPGRQLFGEQWHCELCVPRQV